MSELHRGVVKWFNDAKGFGFIEHESGRDVFVHYSVIEQEGFKTLKDGEEVDYELKEGDKGLNAARVVRVNHIPIEAASETTSNQEESTVADTALPAASMIEVTREKEEISQEPVTETVAPEEPASSSASLE